MQFFCLFGDRKKGGFGWTFFSFRCRDYLGQCTYDVCADRGRGLAKFWPKEGRFREFSSDEGEGGGPQSRKFSRRHMYMPPYGVYWTGLTWKQFESKVKIKEQSVHDGLRWFTYKARSQGAHIRLVSVVSDEYWCILTFALYLQNLKLCPLFRDEEVAELLRSRAGLQPEVALVLSLETAEDPQPLHHEVHRRLLSLKIQIMR